MDKDYNGFLPTESNETIQNGSKSPIQNLTDDLLSKNADNRKYILNHLIKDPGFAATLGEFDVSFEPLEMVSEGDLDSVLITTSQKVRIRRREEGYAAGASLGGNSRTETREG